VAREDDVYPVHVVVPATDGGSVAGRLADALAGAGVPGRVVDTADLGGPGWVVGQALATGDALFGWPTDSPAAGATLSTEAFARELEQSLGLARGAVQVGAEVALGDTAVDPWAVPVLGDFRAVLVRPTGHADEDGPTSHAVGVRFRRCERAGLDLVWRDPETPADDDTLDQLPLMVHGRRTDALLVWRQGRTTGLVGLRGDRLGLSGGRVEETWLHQPGWRPVDPDLGHDGREQVRAAFVADVHDMVSPEPAPGAFAAWGDPVHRRAAMRRDSLDVAELVAALGLPPEVVDVLEGREPDDTVRIEPQTVRAAVRADLDRLAERPGLMGRMERSARAVSPGYLVYNAAHVAVGVAVLAAFLAGVAPLWVLLLVELLVLAQLVDLVVRWRSRRRRTSAASAPPDHAGQ